MLRAVLESRRRVGDVVGGGGDELDGGGRHVSLDGVHQVRLMGVRGDSGGGH